MKRRKLKWVPLPLSATQYISFETTRKTSYVFWSKRKGTSSATHLMRSQKTYLKKWKLKATLWDFLRKTSTRESKDTCSRVYAEVQHEDWLLERQINNTRQYRAKKNAMSRWCGFRFGGSCQHLFEHSSGLDHVQTCARPRTDSESYDSPIHYAFERYSGSIMELHDFTLTRYWFDCYHDLSVE